MTNLYVLHKFLWINHGNWKKVWQNENEIDFLELWD